MRFRVIDIIAIKRSNWNKKNVASLHDYRKEPGYSHYQNINDEAGCENIY